MNWDDICADPTLRDLPYKIETNRRGQIIMSPARSRHGEFQFKIGFLLGNLLPSGKVIMECPVQTKNGVRVPDIAWSSAERRQPVIYTLAPEICVEVLSPFNDEEEMSEKRALYFEAGAKEVWLCGEDGKMRIYGVEGILEASGLCPEFPEMVEI